MRLRFTSRCMPTSRRTTPLPSKKSPHYVYTFNLNTDICYSLYPYMKIKLSAPLEVQNLLPYDFKFRIYDRNTKKEWTNFLRKGGLSPVHVVELSHLLLMNIDMQDTVYNASEFAIINSNDSELAKEDDLVAKDNQGLELRLGLHYLPIPDSGGAFRVTVYSHYVILNKTGLNMMVKSKSLLQQAKVAAGQIQTGNSHGPDFGLYTHIIRFRFFSKSSAILIFIPE